jgi:hypothetical protein
MNLFVRPGLLSLVIGMAVFAASPETASAQFVGGVTVYNIPSYQPIAPVAYYAPAPVYAPVFQAAPVYVPRPVLAPVVVQSAYYGPAPIAVAPAYSYSSYSSYHVVAPLPPRGYTVRYRSTPYGYTYRERAW